MQWAYVIWIYHVEREVYTKLASICDHYDTKTNSHPACLSQRSFLFLLKTYIKQATDSWILCDAQIEMFPHIYLLACTPQKS